MSSNVYLFRIRMRIERERIKLYNVGMKHDLQHPQVLAQSLKLDKLINQYNNQLDMNRASKKPIV